MLRDVKSFNFWPLSTYLSNSGHSVTLWRKWNPSSPPRPLIRPLNALINGLGGEAGFHFLHSVTEHPELGKYVDTAQKLVFTTRWPKCTHKYTVKLFKTTVSLLN